MSARVRGMLMLVGAIAAVAVATRPTSAFQLVSAGGFQLHWPVSRTVLMQMRLDRFVIDPTIDGSTSWRQVAEQAAQAWNGLADVNFTTTAGTAGIGERGNNVNEAYFAPNYEGNGFGEAVAITLYNFNADNGIIVEADVAFDSNRPWNAYRGPVRASSGGGSLYDLRRVATHEFGHVLGLGHPDGAGQSVSAIMNSRLSDLESAQTDDISGLRAIYGGYTATSSRLVAGSTMRGGQWLTSANGRYRLYMQGDSNLVIYDMTDGTALWWTGASAANGLAIFQSDGNFVVYDGDNNPIYFTGTAGNPGAFMVLQDDGNLVIYSAAGVPIWNRTM